MTQDNAISEKSFSVLKAFHGISLSLAAIVAFSAAPAKAQFLKAQAGTQTVEGVTLPASLTTPEGQKLTLVGGGLRTKKVAFVNVKVYVGSFFVADPTKFKKTANEALASTADASPVAVQMHFLRDVDAAKVQGSFKEALEANKVDLKKKEITELLSAVNSAGEAKKGTKLTVLGVKKADGTEVITFEDSNFKAATITGGAGFIKDIFAIWLGHPSDDGVTKLKDSILK